MPIKDFPHYTRDLTKNVTLGRKLSLSYTFLFMLTATTAYLHTGLVLSSGKLTYRIHTYITHTYGCIPCKCLGSTFSPIPVSPLLDSLLHLLTQQVHSSAELCPLCQTQSKSSRSWVWAFCLFVLRDL